MQHLEQALSNAKEKVQRLRDTPSKSKGHARWLARELRTAEIEAGLWQGRLADAQQEQRNE